MVIASSLVLLLVSQATGPQSKPSPPVLQVGVFSYGPDGGPQAAAYETSLASESFQYIAGCVIGGGNRPVPDRATDAWRVSGAVQRMSEDEAVVRIDWQRVRAAGVAVTSPGGSIDLTLHPGDRVPIDSATPEPSAGCGGRTVGFEARFGPRPGWMIGPNGPLTESPAVTIMHSGGGGGFARGAGAGVGAGAGTGGSMSVNGTGHAAAATKSLNAELFLVRANKSRPEQADFNMQGLIVPLGNGVTEFAFSPFALDTPGGPISIQITGTLKIATEDGSAQLVFTTMRTIQYPSSNSGRETTSVLKGSNTTKTPMPGPDDVLSFELPPIRVPSSSATLPDQYSVRVRIR